MSKAIQHLAMNCRDRVAQQEFYCKHFGFKLVRVFNPGRADEFGMLRLGDFCMELFQAADPGDARGGPQKVGFGHLCFQVSDIEARVARFQADGLQMGPVIDCSNHVPGMRVCFFQDLEGNTVELMEGWQDDADLA